MVKILAYIARTMRQPKSRNAHSSNKRIKLKKWEWLTHFGPAFVIFLPAIFSIYRLFKVLIYGAETSDITLTEEVNGLIPFVVLSGIIFINRCRQLRFTRFKIDIDLTTFFEVINRTKSQLNWVILKQNPNEVSAVRKSDFLSFPGELITIRYVHKTIYINVIANPEGYMTITTLGWRKKNQGYFFQHLKNVLNNQPEIAHENEEGVFTKLSMTAVLLRIIFYPICILMLLVLVPMLFEKSIYEGLFLGTICSAFLISDIILLFRSRKKDIS